MPVYMVWKKLVDGKYLWCIGWQPGKPVEAFADEQEARERCKWWNGERSNEVSVSMDRTIKDKKEIISYTTASKCYVVYLTKFFIPDTTEVQIQRVFYSKQKATEYKELLKKRYNFTVEIFIEESEIEIWKQTE